MADTPTTSADVFDPEVLADMAQAKFLGSVKVAGSAAVKEDNTLEGVPGSTVTFPKWNALNDLTDLTEGVDVESQALGETESQAVIKEAGTAVTLTDRARLVAFGDPMGEVSRQFGILAARKVDADLIVTATTGLSTSFDITSTQTAASWDAIVDGITTFGDEWEPEQFAGIYIHSAQQAQLFRDDNFLNAQTLGQMGTPIARGQIGSAGGVPVFVTDRVTAGKLLIVKNGALGLLYKQRPIVEQERHAKGRKTDIVTTMHYATKRLDDRGIARVTLTVAP